MQAVDVPRSMKSHIVTAPSNPFRRSEIYDEGCVNDGCYVFPHYQVGEI